MSTWPTSSALGPIDFRDELPRHPTGKLYKRLLKDEYWAGHESRPRLRQNAVVVTSVYRVVGGICGYLGKREPARAGAVLCFVIPILAVTLVRTTRSGDAARTTGSA